MANRAYLYASDRPDAWDCPVEDYYDSRWTIPLAWFFFYRPDDMQMVDVHYMESHWQEPKFSAEKLAALALFRNRLSLLMAVIDGRASHSMIAEFMAKVEARPGRFLLMDPDEVLEHDSVDAERLASILMLLESGEYSPGSIREAVRPYVGIFDSDPDRFECQIIGYTYS